MIVRFGHFELDLAQVELRRDGSTVPLQPRTYDVLAYLVDHADRVVNKEELLDEVWGTQFVTESTLSTAIKFARQALDDDGRRQEVIKTVHGRGFRFVATIDGRDAAEPTATAAASDLPRERTPLLGRDDDIEAVGRAADEHRVVTLLGIGGIGKTRLAVAVARRRAATQTDGVVYVDLVPATDGASVELAIATAAGVGVTSSGTIGQQLGSVLGDRNVLIVLDNAEHVVMEAAAVVDELVETTSRLRFLITSRVPLGLPDEFRYLVEPLSTGEPSHDVESDGGIDDVSPAAALLRATASRVGAQLTEADNEAVMHICRSLDGLPLAIELAAAQLRQLPAHSLAERLDQRFDVLAEHSRRPNQRHSSLHAVLADTWDALDVSSRTLLVQLTVFPSTFSIRDLDDVYRDEQPGALEIGLGELIDHSLVVRDRADRYRLLETIRLFATRRATSEQLRLAADRHATWCLGRVGRNVRESVVDFRIADWCLAHIADVRSAHRHLDLSGRHAEAAALLAGTALAMHLDTGANAAGVLDLIDQQLRTSNDTELTARLHVAAVMCSMAMRAPNGIAEHGRAALAIADDTGDAAIGCVARVLASWSTVFVDPEAAIEQTTSAARLAADGGWPDLVDLSDAYRSFHLALQRRFDDAVVLSRDVVERAGVNSAHSYPTYSAVAALASLTAIDDPEQAAAGADSLATVPSPEHAMWSNDLVRASVAAAGGDAGSATAIARDIERRLAHAGYDPMPDLLLPPAVYAHQAGDDRRAAELLEHIRSAGRPTQSFQATVVYRRLREVAGDPDVEIDSAKPLATVGEQALSWLESAAGDTAVDQL
ncbi:MAG: winged helix-turn-helix domain-containing protein [Actinomycetota bacterium]